MKRFFVLIVATLAACTQAPSLDGGAPPDLSPLVFGGPGEEGVTDLAGHAGGVYAVGFTTNKAQPNPEGETDVFIRKYGRDRSVLWTRKFGTRHHEFVEGAASDGHDSVYVVGSVFADVGESVFVRKYRADGQLAWARQFGTPPPGENAPPAQNFAKGVATYGSKAVYVVGRAEGDLTGGVGSGNLFIRQYTPSGGVSWTRQFGFTEDAFGFDYVGDVAVDGGGNAYVVGATDAPPSGSAGGNDVFVRKYSPGGAVLWTRWLDFSGDDLSNAVAVSGSNVYVGVGYVFKADPNGVEYSVRIVKFSTGGVRARGWDYRHNPDGSEYVDDLSLDSDGNLYVSGSTESAPGNNDGMVVKLNPSGARVWGKRVASTGNDTAPAVLARTPSEVYVGGLTDGVLGAANRGNIDPYLRRLRGADGSTVWTEQ